MKLLKEKIIECGSVVSNHILLIDAIINHQIDPVLMYKIGQEFQRLAKGKSITKIVTLESSGIAPALMTGYVMGLPVVFAKKYKQDSKLKDYFTTQVHSYTKGITYNVGIKKKFIGKNENILVIDDFLAKGNAIDGLLKILQHTNANIVFIGILVEKRFQDGGRKLRESGFDVKSLIKIKSLANNTILFEE